MKESTKKLIAEINAMPKTWGSEVIPKEKWIDPSKTYKTRGGKRVEHIQIVLHNGIGEEVTNPVKGSIIVREKPRKTEYCIWALDGVWDVVWNNHPELDLIEVS